MLVMSKLFRKLLFCCCVAALINCGLLGFSPCSAWGADLSRRLAAGEIITFTEKAPGSGLKKGEATGMVAASPEKVWEVVTDANSFQEFLPRMIRSRLVRFEELQRILPERPASAAAVEAILSSSPPEVAHFRIPGQKYMGYFYGNLKVPWPLGNRWYIVRVQWDESQAARHTYTCSWSLIIGNLREYSGEWKVQPFGDRHTQLTYRAVTDPGGFVPKFVVEEFTTETLPEVIAGVRRRVAYR
jgi:ribosome-associated toxin RatA of RatAB toxin-antitoxin module